MQQKHASQIALLLNTRNRLVTEYSNSEVLRRAENFLYELVDDNVVACVEVKKVQWYQWEVSHLSVDLQFERRGLGKKLVQTAEEKAVRGGARILQCTIRDDNDPSKYVFERSGFQRVGIFLLPR